MLVAEGDALQYFRFNSLSFEPPFNYFSLPFSHIGGVIVETGDNSVVIDSKYVYTLQYVPQRKDYELIDNLKVS